MYFIIQKWNTQKYKYYFYADLKDFNRSIAKECGSLVCVTNLMFKALHIVNSLNYIKENEIDVSTKEDDDKLKVKRL